MKIVLLSGGSGKRLWPLSNDSRSKQFLKILTSPTNIAESMVQRVWRQIEATNLHEDAYIITGKAQVDVLQSQLGANVPVIVEPDRRDTYPAIALAATYLYSIVGVNLDEVIVILPVDPYVEDDFFSRIKQLEFIVKTSDTDIALIGVKPTYPSEKFGYIVPQSYDANSQEIYIKVSHFSEKPREDKAKELIEQNALWNCGVFAFKLNYLINLLISQNLPIQYDEMLRQYHRLPQNSFDYEVVERAKEIMVMPYDGYWKDLGTWNTLTEEIRKPVIGKGVISEEATNTHIINELDIPVAVLGLSDIIVAVSPDGILVAHKSASPKIKDVIKHLDNRPMYEERRWGYYRVLDYLKYPNSQEVLTRRVCVKAGKHLSYHYHYKRQEVWTILHGQGEMILGDQFRYLQAGDVIHIPAECRHALRATTDMELIEIQTGSELVDEDIVRLAVEWESIIEVVAAVI